MVIILPCIVDQVKMSNIVLTLATIYCAVCGVGFASDDAVNSEENRQIFRDSFGELKQELQGAVCAGQDGGDWVKRVEDKEKMKERMGLYMEMVMGGGLERVSNAVARVGIVHTNWRKIGGGLAEGVNKDDVHDCVRLLKGLKKVCVMCLDEYKKCKSGGLSVWNVSKRELRTCYNGVFVAKKLFEEMFRDR